MRRRDFLALAAATVASWPLPAVAQQPAPGMKRLAFISRAHVARRARREFLVIQCKAPQGKAPEGMDSG